MNCTCRSRLQRGARRPKSRAGLISQKTGSWSRSKKVGSQLKRAAAGHSPAAPDKGLDSAADVVSTAGAAAEATLYVSRRHAVRPLQDGSVEDPIKQPRQSKKESTGDTKTHTSVDPCFRVANPWASRPLPGGRIFRLSRFM